MYVCSGASRFAMASMFVRSVCCLVLAPRFGHVSQVTSTGTLPGILAEMIRFALPGVSDGELCDILRKRCKRPTLADELIRNTDQIQEMVDDDAKHQAEDAAAQAKQQEAAMQTYAQEFQQLQRKLRPQAKAKPKAKGAAQKQQRGRSKPSAAAASVRRPVRPTPVDEQLTEERVNAALPVGHRIWRDGFCCRWMWCRASEYMGSRSWRKHGYVAGAQDLVHCAWTYEVRGGSEAVGGSQSFGVSNGNARRHKMTTSLERGVVSECDACCVARALHQVWVGNEGPDRDIQL